MKHIYKGFVIESEQIKGHGQYYTCNVDLEKYPKMRMDQITGSKLHEVLGLVDMVIEANTESKEAEIGEGACEVVDSDLVNAQKDIKDMTDEDYKAFFEATGSYFSKDDRKDLNIFDASSKAYTIEKLIEEVESVMMPFFAADELRKLGYKVEAKKYE